MNNYEEKHPQNVLPTALLAFFQQGYEAENITLSTIAKACGVSEFFLKHHFSHKENIFIEIVSHAHNLIFEDVFQKLQLRQYSGLRRVAKFLSLVTEFFHNHPEYAFIFKANYIPDVVIGRAYSHIDCFYQAWESLVKKILLGMIPNNIASKISKIYVESIRASMLTVQQTEEVPTCINISKSFLFDSVKKSITKGINKA